MLPSLRPRPALAAAALTAVFAVVLTAVGAFLSTSRPIPAYAAGPGAYRSVVAWTGKCMDVQAQWTADAANVYEWDCVGSAESQQWTFVPTGDGYYYIVARHSGKCLDVAGGSNADEANVYQWTCAGGLNQQWRLQEIPPGSGVVGYFIIARHSNKCLDLYGGLTANETNIQQFTCTGGFTQKWRFA